MVGHVLEQLIQNVQPRVGDVPHGVFEGPDDRIQHQLELIRRYGKESIKTIKIDCL